jgi:tRNA(Ile)-lysidine synthase
MCLALLAARWGNPIALIVDHGLRPESSHEAAITATRLNAIGVPAHIITLSSLTPGPALAARARAARYAALTAAALENCCLDLLLAHHRSDQAETLLIRRAARSGPAGLAAMAPIVHTNALRIVRPLLDLAPADLRGMLRDAGVAWVDDPSNRNPAAQRTRVRTKLADPDGTGAETQALVSAAREAATERAHLEIQVASELAACATIYPAGFAHLTPTLPSPATLAALIQALGGHDYPPDRAAVARLAANPTPASLAGMRLVRAGRLGPGWLLIREAAAIQPPIPAAPGMSWDRRIRISPNAELPPGATIGALGADAARFRRATTLPSAVLATLPALRINAMLAVVPHIGYPDAGTCSRLPIFLAPPVPAAGAPFGA